MTGSPQSVFVCTHDEVARDALLAALEATGFQLETGPIEAVADWVEESRRGVLIVDVTTPGALEAIRGVRASPARTEVGVVALLDESGGDLADIIDSGFDDVVRRPVLAEGVVARVLAQARGAMLRTALINEQRDLQLLLDLTRSFAGTLALRELLQDLVRRLAEAIDVERCSVVLTDAEHDRGVVTVASESDELEDLEIDLGQYPEIQEVMKTREPLIVHSVQTHPLLVGVRDTLAQKGVGALAIFPLIFEDALLGVLFLRRGVGRPFDHRQVGFVRGVADATAVALRNARLFAHIREDAQAATRGRLEAERRLADIRRYQDLYEHVSEGILVLDSDGAITGANPSARALLEGHGVLEGRHLTELGHSPADRSALARILEPGVDNPAAEVRVPGPSGAPLTISARISPLAGGGAVTSFRDVTEARKTEEELVHTKQFLENIIDSSADAIVAADADGRIIIWNSAAAAITGHPREEALNGLFVTDLYPGTTAYEVMRELRSEEGGGVGRVMERRAELRHTDGTRIPVSMSAAILYEAGREVGTMGIFTDLRERLRVEQQAMIAELAGTAAHELNQPLTSVMGYAEMLHRRLTPGDPNEKAVEIILRETERLAQIVRKIGRITRYETKAYLGETRIVDLDRATEEPE